MKQKSGRRLFPAPDAQASSVRCHIDMLAPEGLHGWAMDRQNPAVPVLLDIVVDGNEIGQVLCDGIRPDVEEAQIGPAQVGLSFLLPDWLMDGQPHDLTIRDSSRRIVGFIWDDQIHHSLSFKLDYIPRVLSCGHGGDKPGQWSVGAVLTRAV